MVIGVSSMLECARVKRSIRRVGQSEATVFLGRCYRLIARRFEFVVLSGVVEFSFRQPVERDLLTSNAIGRREARRPRVG